MNGVAALVLIAACGREPPRDRPAPAPGPASDRIVPDVTTIDWRNQSYELSTLGTVTARDGRAEFRLVEDTAGELRADQAPSATGTEGSLVLAPAHFVDLDGDGHDEAILPFVMRSMYPGEAQQVFGAFAYTLREGLPLRIAVVTAEAPVDVDGAALVAGERRWRWTSGRYVEAQ